jgi:hypothetical protein
MLANEFNSSCWGVLESVMAYLKIFVVDFFIQKSSLLLYQRSCGSSKVVAEKINDIFLLPQLLEALIFSEN